MEALAPEEVVRRCRQGLPEDTRDFERLVRLCQQRVFATAYRILGDRSDAEDATQEVFLKVYRGIRSLDDPATFTTWLYRITANTCLDAVDRRARRVKTVPIAPSPETEPGAPETDYADTRNPTPEEAALSDEARRCLEDALRSLDVAGRTALVLRDVEDRSYQEIAGALTLGLSALKMRIHRARIAFQQLLKKLCPDILPYDAVASK